MRENLIWLPMVFLIVGLAGLAELFFTAALGHNWLTDEDYQRIYAGIASIVISALGLLICKLCGIV